MTDIKPLTERIEIIARKKIVDNRGWFVKVLTGKEKGLPNHTGELYTVYSENGAPRGGHYHIQATEWFTVLHGKTNLKLYDVLTHEILTIFLDSNDPQTIVVPPNVAHRFDAIDQNPFLVIAYTDLIYSPSDTTPFNF